MRNYAHTCFTYFTVWVYVRHDTFGTPVMCNLFRVKGVSRIFNLLTVRMCFVGCTLGVRVTLHLVDMRKRVTFLTAYGGSKIKRFDGSIDLIID